MRVLAIIPARYASSRFPGKPLVEIKGKPMVQRVYEQVQKVKEIERVVVATDDDRIADCVRGFGGEALLTSTEHQSGTDRCSEAIKILNDHYDVVINIQGDEPYIHPDQIASVISCFDRSNAQIATLVKEIKAPDELFSPNVVKVVLSDTGRALYFSRQAIPFYRGQESEAWLEKHTYYKHVGIYGFKPDTLIKISKLNTSTLEQAESLEQLRWLQNGYEIHTRFTGFESHAIDTPQDLERLLNI